MYSSLIQVLFVFLISSIEGPMCVNIMVKSVDFLKTPSQSFFPNDHGAKTGWGGGLTTVISAEITRAIEINAHKKTLIFPFF